ncbi:MAG: hypothetical protein ACRENE_33850, partial [Polyangiaceae bacterium]
MTGKNRHGARLFAAVLAIAAPATFGALGTGCASIYGVGDITGVEEGGGSGSDASVSQEGGSGNDAQG